MAFFSKESCTVHMFDLNEDFYVVYTTPLQRQYPKLLAHDERQPALLVHLMFTVIVKI